MDSIVVYISILAGIIAIIGGVAKFFNWIKFRKYSTIDILKVFEKNQDIYGITKDGSEKRLTHNGSSHNPILIKNKSKVVFLKSEKVLREREYTRYIMMSMDLSSFAERVLADQKPYRDGLDRSFEILQPNSLTLSSDQSKIFFIVEKFVTGSALVQIDVNNGKFEVLFSAEKFDIIRSGKFKGKFLVGVSEIRDKGRDIYYHIYDKNGKSLKRFEDYFEYMEYRSNALVGKY